MWFGSAGGELPCVSVWFRAQFGGVHGRLHTGVNLPYCALGQPELTEDTKLRTRLNAARFTGSNSQQPGGPCCFGAHAGGYGGPGYLAMGAAAGSGRGGGHPALGLGWPPRPGSAAGIGATGRSQPVGAHPAQWRFLRVWG